MVFTEKALDKVRAKHEVMIYLFEAENKDSNVRKNARYYLNALENEGILTDAEARAIFCYITL